MDLAGRVRIFVSSLESLFKVCREGGETRSYNARRFPFHMNGIEDAWGRDTGHDVVLTDCRDFRDIPADPDYVQLQP